MPGPLQVIAVGFGPGADFEGRVLAEVDRLEGRGVLRLLDVLFVSKDEDGAIQQLVVGDDEDFGALLASVVPLDGAGLGERSTSGAWSGFDPSDAWALAESLRPGTALAFLLIEHGWAQPLFDAIAETGGVLVGEGFLTAEAGLVVGAEVAAMEEAAGVIAAAQAAEVNATLEAMTAQARASEAIAASEAIRAAAAAAAIRALIDAGVVAEEAAQEAVEAVAAAGLVVAAADEAVGELCGGGGSGADRPRRRPPRRRSRRRPRPSKLRRSRWPRRGSCGTCPRSRRSRSSLTNWGSPDPRRRIEPSVSTRNWGFTAGPKPSAGPGPLGSLTD